MAKTPRKVMVLGVDAPIVPRVYAWAREGKLPTLQRLMAEGVYAPNCLVPHPTITPPGWTSIATGAWPGTHGVTDFDAHTPGTALDLTHKAFDSSEILAEPIWCAAERAGKRTAKRKEIYREVTQIILDECWCIPIAEQPRVWAVQKHVQNFAYTLDNNPLWHGVWLSK